MNRLACGIEYDGTGFRGWQAQPPGVRTIQAAVEEALARVADHPVQTVCAGRTDAGVHAVGQVIHFDTDSVRSEKAWLMGGNTHLPADVAIRWARPVTGDFDARYSAVARSYRYLVFEGWDRPALWRRRALWSHCTLDTDAMTAAARPLLGEHDFSAFRSAECQATHAVRRLEQLQVRRNGPTVTIDVRANAFLHNMVRILVGTLLVVGRGERPIDWPVELLTGRDRTASGATAPAHGLYLLGPSYPDEYALPAPRETIWPLSGKASVLS